MIVGPGTVHLVMPRYSFAEADHLAAVSRRTTRRWLASGDQVEERSHFSILWRSLPLAG
jgi:hypothetical protein